MHPIMRVINPMQLIYASKRTRKHQSCKTSHGRARNIGHRIMQIYWQFLIASMVRLEQFEIFKCNLDYIA